MTVPQTAEEEKLMYKSIQDFKMKRTNNNITHIMENKIFFDVFVGGTIKRDDFREAIPDLEETLARREGLYSTQGFKYSFPITSSPISPIVP